MFGKDRPLGCKGRSWGERRERDGVEGLDGGVRVVERIVDKSGMKSLKVEIPCSDA